ncbi:MAG: selenocysteine-specific translation elongation factor [FCB group bacterium]|nr:selenocysteine-specific translation elongation factor [FCB group bacterium]
MHHKVICTAGHIDHGKTSLTKALTGTDTDSLSEEKLRGITIDLGFAYYREDVSLIDLPGHERFIRNMAAGAATVDFAILIVAADDGPMPQTREHLDILHLLGVPDGMIVITKIDLVEDDWADLVAEETLDICRGTFLEGKPVVKADSVSGRGMDEFKLAFHAALDNIPPRNVRPQFRQPVDRSFTIKGFGTVITGTVISGQVSVKESVQHLPSGDIFKVRGIQIQGRDCKTADTGTRAALNLSGAEKADIVRGGIIAEPGLLEPCSRIDCKVELLPSAQPMKHRQWLRFHIGTAEIIGRILLLEDNTLMPGDSMFAQLELEKPVTALRGDRFVFRIYSPQTTSGGGVVLMNSSEKHKRRRKPLLDLLDTLAGGNTENIIIGLSSASGAAGITENDLLVKGGLVRSELVDSVKLMTVARILITQKTGGVNWYTTPDYYADNQKRLEAAATDFHRKYPAKPGITLAELKSSLKMIGDSPFAEAAVQDLVSTGILRRDESFYALSSHEIKLNKKQQALADGIMERISIAGLNAPKANPIADELEVSVAEVLDMMAILESMGDLVRLDRNSVISSEVYEQYCRKLKAALGDKDKFTLPEAVSALGASRRSAVGLLEYMDKVGFTEQLGDERRIKK